MIRIIVLPTGVCLIPTKKPAQLQELVAVANENEVDFVWAIHPGQDIKWNQEDRDLLLAKFEKMYQARCPFVRRIL